MTERTVRVAASHEPVEVVTRIPAGVARVVVTIEVEPGEPARPPPASLSGDFARQGPPAPRLLFVTEPERLAANVGEAERRQALAAIRDAGQSLLELPSGADAVALVRRRSTPGSAASSSSAAMTSCPPSAATAFRRRCARRSA